MPQDPITQEKQGLFSSLFGSSKKDPKHDHSIPSTSLLKQRKAPIKVEPKVFFANERTFLAWMHISIILAGASIAILAFAEEGNTASQVYGIVMLPVAVAFIVYSMYQCKLSSCCPFLFLFEAMNSYFSLFVLSRCKEGIHDSKQAPWPIRRHSRTYRPRDNADAINRMPICNQIILDVGIKLLLPNEVN